MLLAFKKLLLAVIPVIGIVAGLFLTEKALRIRNPDYLRRISRDNINLVHTYSRVYGWRLQEGTWPGGLIVNSRGYRGREYRYAKPAGQTRIVVLGDSIAFGCDVTDEQTFSAILDSSRADVEVVNLAVQGYGTDQQMIRLEKEGLRYRPDIVLLGFCTANDFEDNRRSKYLYDNEHPKPYFVVKDGELIRKDRHVRLSLFRGWAFVLSQKSLLYNTLLDRLKVDRHDHIRQLAPTQVVNPDAGEITYRLIRRIQDICDARGIRFMVLAFPNKHYFKETGPEGVREQFDTPILDGVRVVNLMEFYVQAGMDVTNYGRYAMDRTFHLTPEGHELTARIV